VGKSILCIHFAYAGLRAGDPVVYVTTEQEFRDVMEQAEQFGMDFTKFTIYSIAWRKEPEKAPQIVVIDIFGLLKVARQTDGEGQGGEPGEGAALRRALHRHVDRGGKQGLRDLGRG
jgi:KaiC/GvpD/RAD55 family RecA-like ATPase